LLILPTRTSPVKGLNNSKRKETYPQKKGGNNNPDYDYDESKQNFPNMRYQTHYTIAILEERGFPLQRVCNFSHDNESLITL
jgi:hypothetical protein